MQLRADVTKASFVLVIVALLGLQQQSYAGEAAGQAQTAHSSCLFTHAISREPDGGKARVFENALLDKVFATGSAASKREDKPDDSAAHQSGATKPLPPVARPTLLPTDSFAAKITSRTPSTLAAALRFAEQGRKETQLRQYHKALNVFERAVSLGLQSYLPYIYYYLAQTHYHLANYHYAFNFLEVAESWLSEYSDWMTAIAALRQYNINAMGYAQASAVRAKP